MAASGPAPEFAQASVPLALPAADARTAAAAARLYRRYGKRALDLALGALLLIAALPLIAAVALAVFVASGWPLIHRSERVGLAGRPFMMWKFRTMVRDADAVAARWQKTHPERASELQTHWRLRDDPRITALGRFLRKSSLDELPQIWNVLRGEMSLVGPRPYLSREAIDPALLPAIVAVRPGLTGPFQVCGRKGLAPRARMELEAAYAPSMSLLGDAAYLLRTAKPLFTLDGS